ncbi:hypothetical protein DPMN_078772 [Dreissena polymorpha]|uniref:Uncharacterized protein n=1 Tax=Dreissena polymorpha TaxID=45954 RepID=A0A9D4BPG4_DREPO|nr:hypothetical protein DPMN_078772 [Dreissena polymorpha]
MALVRSPERKNCPPPDGHVIQLTGTIFKLNSHIKETNFLTKFHENWTIFELVRVINKTNVLTNFHDDWAKIVTSRVFTSHVIQLTGTIFKLNSHIKETNVLTKFHENWAKNVTSRVFTCFHFIEKNSPPTSGHVFSPIWAIFELVQDINKTNILTNFYDDWAKIHVIELTGTIFELNSYIKETNVLTEFHENWAKNVTSRVFICFHYIHIEKNAPPNWRPYINKTNVLTNFHDDWAKIVTSRVSTNDVIELTGTIFVLYSHIKETNVHENWAKNVTSRVFTCFHYIHIEKTALHTGGHVFSPIWTNFELVRDVNKTNVLTNFHDGWAKVVTSRVFTRKTAPPTGGHVFQRTGTTFKLNQHIIKTNILTKLHEDWA